MVFCTTRDKTLIKKQIEIGIGIGIEEGTMSFDIGMVIPLLVGLVFVTREAACFTSAPFLSFLTSERAISGRDGRCRMRYLTGQLSSVIVNFIKFMRYSLSPSIVAGTRVLIIVTN